jgi:hypothetical protein
MFAVPTDGAAHARDAQLGGARVRQAIVTTRPQWKAQNRRAHCTPDSNATKLWQVCRNRPGGDIMRSVPNVVVAGLLALATVGTGPRVALSQAPGFDPGRDCQTVRSCNFSRRGAFRGCISAYTCRTCRLVRSRCSVGATAGTCQRMVCTWGG